MPRYTFKRLIGFWFRVQTSPEPAATSARPSGCDLVPKKKKSTLPDVIAQLDEMICYVNSGSSKEDTERRVQYVLPTLERVLQAREGTCAPPGPCG
jgi:hypothetical protein